VENQISGKWVVIGAVIIIALNQVESHLLIEPLGIPLMTSMGLIGGLLVFALIISILSFFVGGVLIGRMSPGVTTKEAGYASLIAIALNVVVNAVQTGHVPNFIGIAIVAGIGYGLGVLGGKVGEAWQAKAEGPMNAPPSARVVQGGDPNQPPM
jgi:hypothetical protein